MKRSLALAAVLAFMLSSAAFAGVHDFGKFSVDVLDGWSATQDGETAIITKNDNSAQLTILISDAEGAAKSQLAEAFVSEFKKSGTYVKITEPEADNDGDFSWDMTTKAGAESHAMLTIDGKDFVLLIMTNTQAAPDDFTKMLGSIKQK